MLQGRLASAEYVERDGEHPLVIQAVPAVGDEGRFLHPFDDALVVKLAIQIPFGQERNGMCASRCMIGVCPQRMSDVLTAAMPR